MRKKAFLILITFMLGSAGVLSPAFYALAAGPAAASAYVPQGASAYVSDAKGAMALKAKESSGGAEDAAQGQEETTGKGQQEGVGGILQQGAELGQELYNKMDEAVDSVDKASLRSSIREALEEMDRMGISPTAIAENTLGLKPASSDGGKLPENTLIEDAQRTVRKKTEGFFTVLWDGFLDTLGNMITTGITIFSGQKGSDR